MKPWTIVKIAASVGLIGLILWTIGPAVLVRTFAEFEPSRVAMIVLLTAAFICARALKWMIVARAEIAGLSYGRALWSLVGGMGLGMVTPARAGEFSRAFFLDEGDRVTLVGLFTVDRVLDLLTIVAFGAVAAGVVGFSEVALVGVAATAVGTGLLLGLSRAIQLLLPAARKLRVGGIAQRLGDGVAKVDRTRLLVAMLASVGSTAVGYLQFHVILGQFVEIPLAAASLAFSGMILSNLLPVSIAGLGVREWVSVLLLREYGVPDAVAVNAAFFSYILNTVSPGILGALMVSRARLTNDVEAVGGTTGK